MQLEMSNKNRQLRMCLTKISNNINSYRINKQNPWVNESQKSNKSRK